MFSKKSKWITAGKEFSSPIISKRFRVCKIKSATIDICGLGYYELFINGRRVSEAYYKPVVSDYSERDFSRFLYPLSDKTSHTIYYNSYDVSEYLTDGDNTLSVMLGNGFYRQTKRLAEGNTSFGDALLLRFELRLTDDSGMRTVYTDGTERAVEGFIKENNLFYGEVHDYDGFPENVFSDRTGVETCDVQAVSSPRARLLKQRCCNDVVREIITPKIVKTTPESVIYDIGKNISGFVSLKAKSSVVRVRHAEEMKDGALDFQSAGGDGQISENVYKNAQGRTVHPWFSWSGFRYFEVFGEAEAVEAVYVCADIAVRASFKSGNETLNWLFESYLDTQIANMHGGVPSDCPHRERLGYTGDGQLTAESAMLLLDCRSFYEKWIRDIADCQDVASGHVQHTAPFFGGGGGPGGWGCAMVVVPYAYYRIYGDTSILKKYYPNMLKYIESMQTFCDGGLVVREREKGWCLGDWCTPEQVVLPEPFVNTFYYIRSMKLVQEIAEILGGKVDYGKEIALSECALKEAYYDPKNGDFCSGRQGANAFALLLGLGDERTKKNLLERYRAEKVFDTGIFGTDVLTEYLTRSGEIQLLYDLLSAEKFPSFGYMRANGATTLWERWQGAESHNHPMFGACVKQFFYGLLGLSADAGMKRIAVSPRYIAGIDFIDATLRFSHGSVRFRYRYRDGKVESDVSTSGNIRLKK